MVTKKVDWSKLDTPIEYFGRAITLPGEPGKMPLKAAVDALQRKIADEDQDYLVHESFDYHPHDAAVAFVKAMTLLYGWASPQSDHTWFGLRPPQMLSVRTGPAVDDLVQVPIGRFTLPGCDKAIETTIHGNQYLAHGTLQKKNRHIILELATETRKILKESSIYKGKAISLKVDSTGDLMESVPPDFMNVSDISKAALMFNTETAMQIQDNLMVPLKFTARCREENVPLKRGVLLEGPYGTGKSLTARLTAKVAQENGWTFVLLDKVQGLKAALVFARKYAPAVVFAEDVDRILSERTDEANDLVNTIDGVLSKSDEVMVVLTTNHVDKIAQVGLRPGRIDAVISLRAPDASTVEKLLRYYAGPLLPEGAKLTNSGKELAGQIPAFIRECVERAKLGMIGRNDHTLKDTDLVVSAQSMKNHLRLMEVKVDAQSVGDRLHHALRDAVNGHDEEIKRIDNRSMRILNRTRDILDNMSS